MSLNQMDISKKLISAPTVVSSFVGIMLAVPLAFALRAPMSASAVQPASQVVTSQANVEEFARYAHAFNQGYEASLASTSASSSSGDGVSCAVVETPTATQVSAGKGSASTQQGNYYVAPSVGGRGGGGSAKMSSRVAAMTSSYYNYTSMVNNSSTVNNNNTNSNNTVGSNNSTKTSLNLDANHTRGDIKIGISNESNSVQQNANESFNKDSYNTTTETSIINDSFKKDSENTTTISTDIDVSKNLAVGSYNTKTEVENETEISTDNSVDNSNSGNGSGNGSGNVDNSQVDNSTTTTTTTDVDIDADVEILSDNELEVTTPEMQV